MNAVFEPSLLFISQEDWLDEDRKLDFLELLLCHLDNIDKYDICKILWTEKLQVSLFEQPDKHPWLGADTKELLVPIIYKKFFFRQEIISSHATISQMTPSLLESFFDNQVFDNFLKLVHTLVDDKTSFYFCRGLNGELAAADCFFECECGNTLKPPHLITCNDWFQYIKPVDFFPTSIGDFEGKLEKAVDIIRKRDFDDNPILYEYKFTEKFKKSLIKTRTFQEEILTAITKKLTLTAEQARNDSHLQDEYVTKRKVYRIRVTQRPHSTRIHYKIEDEEIIFLDYFDEGQHNKGL